MMILVVLSHTNIIVVRIISQVESLCNDLPVHMSFGSLSSLMIESTHVSEYAMTSHCQNIEQKPGKHAKTPFAANSM